MPKPMTKEEIKKIIEKYACYDDGCVANMVETIHDALPDIEPLDENNLVEYLWERFGFRDIDCLDDWRTIVKAICQRFSKLQLTQEEFEGYLPEENTIAINEDDGRFNDGFNSAIQQAKENFRNRDKRP